jgi:hypothetical protein
MSLPLTSAETDELNAVLRRAAERLERKKVPICEQAKSAQPERPVFTNCGNTEDQQTLVKSAKRLTRVPFKVSRLMEFCTQRELVNQTGHQYFEWPLVVLKELIDNALDAAEEIEIAPVVSIAVNGGSIVIRDKGPGIPADTIKGILDYAIRVSSREAYVSPTRGAQGNALKTILPMGYILNESAHGESIIEARGAAHHIRFSVDHIMQAPQLQHTMKPSRVVNGTRIKIQLPKCQDGEDILDDAMHEFLRLAESYAWFNPALTLRLSWNGEQVLDIKASNPKWRKWLPTWPTSAHWYDKSRFRRYMAAHIANRESITVREFISEFRGMTGTAKQKLVLAETGASHVSLHNYFGVHKVNVANIAKHTKPVNPSDLGIIGKDHLYCMMELAGGDPATFTYNRKIGETNGMPRVIEFAFGFHRDGLSASGRVPSGKIITGVNWSPGINNPFRQLGRGGDSLDAIFERVRANTSQPVIAALHLACPRVAYTDRGKSSIVVEGNPVEGHDGEEN